MIPKDAQQIRDWVERMAITHALAAEALGLGNADTVMREYCSDRRQPAMTTRLHMDLLEVTLAAFKLLQTGQVHKARVLLSNALDQRGLVDVRQDNSPPPTTKESL